MVPQKSVDDARFMLRDYIRLHMSNKIRATYEQALNTIFTEVDRLSTLVSIWQEEGRKHVARLREIDVLNARIIELEKQLTKEK